MTDFDGVQPMKGIGCPTAPSTGGDCAPSMSPPIPFEEIIRAVCASYRVSRNEIMSNRRLAELVRARWAAMWLARELTLLSYPSLGYLMNRDHTSVMWACNKIDTMMKDGRAEVAPIIGLKQLLISRYLPGALERTPNSLGSYSRGSLSQVK